MKPNDENEDRGATISELEKIRRTKGAPSISLIVSKRQSQ
jgi:hypothetical protein